MKKQALSILLRWSSLISPATSVYKASKYCSSCHVLLSSRAIASYHSVTTHTRFQIEYASIDGPYNGSLLEGAMKKGKHIYLTTPYSVGRDSHSKKVSCGSKSVTTAVFRA